MSRKKGFVKKILAVLRKNKKLRYMIYALTAGAAVLLYFSGDKKQSAAAPAAEVVSAAEVQTEERLSEVLSEIRGAGRVTVMITYDTTTEIVPAMSSSKQSAESQTDGSASKNESEQNQVATVNKGGEQTPVVLTQIQPRVRGVIIIAEGAADISVKLNLEYAAATVLGIDTDLIEVFEMRGVD